jgi:hypothetical protein
MLHIYAWAAHQHARGLRSTMSLYRHPTQAIQLVTLVGRGLESRGNPRGFGGSILSVPGGDWSVH